MKKILFIFICCWGFTCHAVTVKLSRSNITAGESVELIFSDSNPIGSIDFTPLNKSFMLGGQSSGQTSQYINGVGSTTYQKSIVLFPLKEGTIEIPELSVGQEKTPSLTLNIQKTNQAQTSSNLPKLMASVSENSPYVGQSLFYTLTLSENENLVEAELIPNFPEGIKLTSIGQDTEKQKNNKIVLERPYLIKVEKIGPIEILPAVLNGSILYQKEQKFQGQGLFSILNSSDIFNAFSTRTKPIQIISNPLKLTIQEKPSDWKGWWLPTTKADLKIQTEIPENLKAGDIFKVILTLTAKDVDSNDLPIPKLPNNSDFRYYPQPEERQVSISKDGHFQGTVKITYEIMPLKEGELTLPNISIPWFNTKSAKVENASITPLLLKVKSGNIEEFLKPAITTKTERQAPPSPQKEKFSILFICISIAGTLGIVAGLFFIFKYIRRKKKEQKKEKPIPDFYPF